MNEPTVKEGKGMRGLSGTLQWCRTLKPREIRFVKWEQRQASPAHACAHVGHLRCGATEARVILHGGHRSQLLFIARVFLKGTIGEMLYCGDCFEMYRNTQSYVGSVLMN